MITCETAKHYLETSNYHVVDIKLIPEGSNHKVFIVTLEDNRKVICKFPIQRHTETDHTSKHLDTLFGGELSLDRETSLYNLARESGHVPAPIVFDHVRVDDIEFIVLELMSGESFAEFLNKNNHSKSTYLSSLNKLGRDFANIQKISFESYGNIMKDKIMPEHLLNFVDYFTTIINNRIEKAFKKGAFTKDELKIIKEFFTEKLWYFKPLLDHELTPPVMVFTDMHADNYFVDATGKPSGYFDLESSQAAPAALEFYGMRFFLFNYYDSATMIEAEQSFFEGYNDAGGLYAPQSDMDHQLIDFLSACRLLELTESYWGHRDGLRDLWAFKMKNILMQYLFTDQVDYISLSNIFREKTLQPHHPN